MKRIPYFLLREGHQYILRDLDGIDKKIEYLENTKRGRMLKIIEDDVEFIAPNELMNEMEFYSIE